MIHNKENNNNNGTTAMFGRNASRPESDNSTIFINHNSVDTIDKMNDCVHHSAAICPKGSSYSLVYALRCETAGISTLTSMVAQWSPRNRPQNYKQQLFQTDSPRFLVGYVDPKELPVVTWR